MTPAFDASQQSAPIEVVRTDTRLLPDRGRVIAKRYMPVDEVFPDGRTRIELVVDRILAMSDSDVTTTVTSIQSKFSERHRNLDAILEESFAAVADRIGDRSELSDDRRRLIGAYFTIGGGISAVELGVDGVRRVALPVDAGALASRLVLAYTNATRNSGINNWEVTKRHIDKDRDVQARFATIRDIAIAMRAALERGDWGEVGRQIALEWDNRKQLASGVTTAGIDALLDTARAAGALGGKVCGAGGGGCLFCLGDPADVPAIRRALASAGARVLDFTIESHGLVVETHATEPVPAA